MPLSSIHTDERGDEGVNKILVVAMVAIPLVLVLVFFADEIVGVLEDAWTALTGAGSSDVMSWDDAAPFDHEAVATSQADAIAHTLSAWVAEQGWGFETEDLNAHMAATHAGIEQDAEGRCLDPWGNPYEINGNEESVWVTSAGQDGEPNNDDDIRVEVAR